MESSQDEEECRSSESGWTMYLGSPMEDSGITDGDVDDDEQDQEAEEQSNLYDVEGEEEDHGVGNEDDGNGHDTDSGDSMASDASSRPRCPEFWAKSDEKGKQGKVNVQGRGKIRKNLKMGKK